MTQRPQQTESFATVNSSGGVTVDVGKLMLSPKVRADLKAIEEIAAMTERPQQTEPECPACNGNDRDMPCAYPGEGKPGCLRDARLAAPDDVEALLRRFNDSVVAWAYRGGEARLVARDDSWAALLAAFARLKEERDRLHAMYTSTIMTGNRLLNELNQRIAALERENERLRTTCGNASMYIAKLHRNGCGLDEGLMIMSQLHQHMTKEEFRAGAAALDGYEGKCPRCERLESALSRYQWVPVSEQKPPEDVDVWTYSAEFADVDRLRYRHSSEIKFRWFSPLSGNYQGERYAESITHWMPLPPLPAEKETDKFSGSATKFINFGPLPGAEKETSK